MVTKKKREKGKKWTIFCGFLGKLFIPGDTVPKPHYLQVLIGRAEATVKQTSKTWKCRNYWNSVFFSSCSFCLVGFCLVLFKWARNRDVAGIKVNQARRHKSNIVFTDQGTCVSFSKRYIFTIPFFYITVSSTPLLPNRLFPSPPLFELLLFSTFKFQAWPCLFNLITIFFQGFLFLFKAGTPTLFFFFKQMS